VSAGRDLGGVAAGVLQGGELRGFRVRVRLPYGEKKRSAHEFYLLSVVSGSRVKDLYSPGVTGRCLLGLVWQRRQSPEELDAALAALVEPVRAWLKDEMQLLCLGTGVGQPEEVLRGLERRLQGG